MADTAVLLADGRIDLSQRLQSGFPWPLGTRFVVYSDGNSLLLKPAASDGAPDFAVMTKRFQTLADENDLNSAESIKAVQLQEIKDLHGIFAGMDAPDKKELRRMFHEDHLD